MAESSVSTNRIGQIPVRNLWLLMLYASDLMSAPGQRKIDVEDNPDKIPDLVAEVLAEVVRKRLHKNLSFGFRAKSARLNRVRGRIDFITTISHQLLSRGKIACNFEDLTIDTPRNRLVLSALEKVSKVVK